MNATDPPGAADPPSRTLYFNFGADEGGFPLACGRSLPEVTLAYQTWGRLNETKSNGVMIFHALTGDAHVAGRHEDGRTGWWDLMVGPGRAFDTDRWFIVCANVIGGCKGSTGPSTIDSRTGKPYGFDFPFITVEDMVRAQHRLLGHLGIARLHGVAGGSMGGMQALAFSRLFPGATENVICVASGASLSAQGIAWNEIGRRAILQDPNFRGGDYYGGEPPVKGLALARMIGHLTYSSREGFERKFGRRRQDRHDPAFHFDIEFEIESYLESRGERFTQRFDANSYLYVTRAVDYFDFGDDRAQLVRAFSETQSRFLFLSYSGDWLYPTSQSVALVEAARAAGREAVHHDIKAPLGHDSFLILEEPQTALTRDFL